jgi:hypothetical protein
MHDLGGIVPGSDVFAVFGNIPPMAVLWPFLLAAGNLYVEAGRAAHLTDELMLDLLRGRLRRT